MKLCVVGNGFGRATTVAVEDEATDEEIKASALKNFKSEGFDVKKADIIKQTHCKHPVENFNRFLNALQLSINSTVSKTFNTGE